MAGAALAEVPVTEPEEGRRWYSIPEAAEYLGVSEPTVFRWMKDQTLSFYKVGGSTRFTKEGLDAVAEKTTGRGEARAAAGRCPACGHAELAEGRLRGSGRLYFQPDKAKFWVWTESLVETKAKVCTACGHLALFADAGKLRKLKPDGRGK